MKAEYDALIRQKEEALSLVQNLNVEEKRRLEVEKEKLAREYQEKLASERASYEASQAQYTQQLSAQQQQQAQSEAQLTSTMAALSHQHASETAQLQTLRIPEEAFGAKAWKEYFGVEVDTEPKLPDDIEEILNAEAPFLLEDETTHRPVRENHLLTLIPGKVDGVPFTLDKLGAMLLENRKGHFSAFSGNANTTMGSNSHGYKYYTKYLKDADRTRALTGAPYWVLLSKTILVGSREKDKSGHASLVNKHRSSGYRMPHALEVATSLLSHYARSGGTRLYADENSNNYWTFTRCVEEDKDGDSIFVGGFEPAGLIVSGSRYGGSGDGVSGCRKFS